MSFLLAGMALATPKNQDRIIYWCYFTGWIVCFIISEVLERKKTKKKKVGLK